MPDWLAALLAWLGITLGAGECIEIGVDGGGMTQIDPPSMFLCAGAADEAADSAVDDADGVVVLQ